MKYTNSSLVNHTRLSPNHSGQRRHIIDTITIHCVCGQVTAESLGEWFSHKSTQASSNYGVDKDGRIGFYVEEKNRSWCSSSSENDNRAITIEVASDKTHPYTVTDKAYEGLIRLLVDICKRNNIEKLLWKADKNLIGQIDKQNMTVHRWFSNKSCPGEYLYSRHGKIAEEVNRRLNQNPNVHPILSKPTATLQQIEKWTKSKNDDEEFISLARIYYESSVKIGLNPTLAFAQMSYETGFLYKVKSSAGLDRSFHNPCGLKTSEGGGDFDKNAHKKFNSWEEGISAHLDHLALYAGAEGYPRKDTTDPRHFPYIFGKAKTVEELSGKWAPSSSYHKSIVKFMNEIESVKVDDIKGPVDEPSDWAKESFEKAKKYKLMDGTRPKDKVTREELASVAVRLYEYFEKSL